MGAKSRRKGYRIEREVVQLHKAAGIDAQRVPLSGAAGGHYSGDLLIAGHLVGEVKARASGQGFKTLASWLSGADLLFLRQDRAEPLVAMPWSTYAALMANDGTLLKNAETKGG